RDYSSDYEERWITVGAIKSSSIILVDHTFYEKHNEEVIRIISARAAESQERRAYEEAHKGTEAGHPSHRRKKRRRHRLLGCSPGCRLERSRNRQALPPCK